MKITLTKKLKQKWIKALRGGEFKQGRGRLKKANRHCCLGVLQAIAPDIKSDSIYLLADIRNSRSYITGLPISKQQTLATMNDDANDFLEISNWIEKRINPKQ